ncbi:acrylyl-CoA reductase family protein [Listeria aquatica]|uniref:acrylyl-CoA reductase family protein n=1 Tax=Listeria aquatica TaxID=1494960 RepID=UPI003F7086B7
MTAFRALFVDQKNPEETSLEIKSIQLDDLPEGDVTIRVHYSGINYKDGLATLANGNIVKNYPFIPGIDAAGVVIASSDPEFKEGDPVIVTSYELGVSHFGGYSEYIRVPSKWVVPLPDGLTLREAMIYGTAGFTAAMSVLALQDHGAEPQDGKVAVSGATGGVGSFATAILSELGFSVVASSGKQGREDYLAKLGADEVVSREAFQPEKLRPLDKEQFAHAIDCVGGKPLSYLLSTTKYGGSVTTCGMSAGYQLNTAVYPFILRGIHLLGIDSVYCPYPRRKEVWHHIATDFKLDSLLDWVTTEITLQDLPEALEKNIQGGILGRYLVRLI